MGGIPSNSTLLYPENLTLPEAAGFARCSARTLQRLIEEGEGPPVVQLSARRIVFRRSDLTAWIEGRQRHSGAAKDREA